MLRKDFDEYNQMNEEEAEAAVEDILNWLREAAKKDSKPRRFVSDPVREQLVEKLYNVLSYIMSSTGAVVSYERRYANFASIRITGTEIVIRDPKLFMAVAKMADNIDIYPKTDSTVCMTLSFNKMLIYFD